MAPLENKEYDLNTLRGQTLLSINAEKVKNKSIQRYMDTIKGKVREGKTIDRFDQSPQPNYPNFEPVK